MRHLLAASLALALALPAHALTLHGRLDTGGRVTVVATKKLYGLYKGTWRCRGTDCPVRRGRVGFGCTFGNRNAGTITWSGPTCYWVGACAGRGVVQGRLFCGGTRGFYLQ